jgi:DNA polymerase III subunit delta'
MRLEELAGQNHAVALLLRAVEVGRVPHAYLFDGPPGVGKRTAAIGLGLALICAEAPGKGCGRCDQCHRILAGNHPDVRVIVPATLQILMEQTQEIVRLASSRPHEAPARVIVLDEADRLNPNSANSLLKTLEEPFPGTHLVLVTTAPDRLLPTILSRTQRVRFIPVRSSVMIELATRRGVDAQRAEVAAALAAGSVGRFFELLGTEGEDSRWQVAATLRKAASAPDMGAIFDAAMAVGDKEGKETLPETLMLLGRFYRDALAAASGAQDLVLLRGRADELERLAAASRKHATLGPLRRALAAVLEADTALVGNANAVLAVERMLLEMRACERGVTP